MEEYKVGDFVTIKEPIVGQIVRIEEHYGNRIVYVNIREQEVPAYAANIIYKHN